MNSPHLQRAQLLLAQSRFAEAEEYARQSISENVDDPDGYLFLAHALSEQSRHQDALTAAQQALALAPDFPRCHYILATIHYEMGSWSKAKAAAQETLRLDPDDADAYGLMAYLVARQAKWEESLDYAEKGLAIDSDHTTCANARANALMKLKRADHAQDSIDYALQRDPDNPYSHYQKGRLLLESNRYDEAAQHFCEALRLEPDFDAAREGLVEALKGKHFLYSLFLRYTVFMSRLAPRTQLGIVIGGYFAYRILHNMLSAQGHHLAASIVLFAYLALAFFTWTASSLFNLLLFLHPLGRHALSPKQKRVSAGVGAAILLAVSTGALHFATQASLLLPAIAFLIITLPLASIERIWRPTKLKAALVLVGLQATAAFSSAALALSAQADLAGSIALVAIISGVAYTWLSSFFTS